MGTEVTAFNNARPAAVFNGVNSGESLGDGIGASYGTLGYRGKQWSLRYHGETHLFTRADDGTSLPFLDVIILRQLPFKSKTYYPEGSFDQEGSAGQRPVCASLDGVKPDEDVTEKQAAACAICPRNVTKVNAKGRKSRECRDYKRLAVLVVPKLTKQLLGAALLEPVYLKVPAASMSAMVAMDDRMRNQGWEYFTYVTRIGFIPEASHPQMTFKEHVPLTAEEGAVVLPLRDDPLAKRITGESELSRAPGLTRNIATEPAAQEIIAPEPAKVAAPAKVQPVVIEQEDEGSGFNVGPGAALVQPVAGRKPKPAPKVIAAPVDDDDDVVDEAVSDLDARVAAILKTQ